MASRSDRYLLQQPALACPKWYPEGIDDVVLLAFLQPCIYTWVDRTVETVGAHLIDSCILKWDRVFEHIDPFFHVG